EGVGYNIKWALQIVEKLVGETKKINVIGGGANSEIWCQILSDILDRKIVQLSEPELAGAKGSAIVSMVGLGIFKTFSDAIPLIKIKKEYEPNSDNTELYQKIFTEFMKVYKRNKRMFELLNT
ncbi:MAG: FGGY-family carbohydrate kinase, partial [Promethearchaeota archaeon]